jgi:GNAT superfamily N-acetyltransferase
MDQIAIAAKASWGYSAEQLGAWRQDLVTPPETLDFRPTFVAEEGGKVCGFAQIDPTSTPWQLVAIWVAPQHMGKGIGRALLCRLAREAHQSGQEFLAVDSDPNAEQFYRTCGATVVGYVSAPIVGQPDRRRPRLLLPARSL